MKLILAILLSALGLAAQSSLLVTPQWLAAHLHDPNLILLDVGQSTRPGGQHIPGTQPISLDDISVSKPLTLELPPVDQLTADLEALGISNDSRVVAYADTAPGTIAATRVVWTLAWYGLGDHVSLLDGGLSAWEAAGHPVSSAAPAPRRGTLTPHLHPEYFADAAWVTAHLHQPDLALLDGRYAKSYTGDGHIPGARSLPIEDLLDANGTFKDKAALQTLLQQAGARPGEAIASYCYIGERATTIWLAARLLGHPARVYDGAWEDWYARKLPTEH